MQRATSIQIREDGDPLAPHSLSATELKELLAAERDRLPHLVFRDQLGLLHIFAIPDTGRPTTVGRKGGTDVPIGWDGEVSGLHAELETLSGEVTVADDGLSTNGTYVNGRRITRRQRLRDGDRIRVGQTVLAYRSPEEALATETISALDKPELLKLTEMQRAVLISLCRPFRDGVAFATPATNQEIATEVCLSVDAVKTNLRALFGKFELNDLPQNQKRTRLVECALQLGIVTHEELI